MNEKNEILFVKANYKDYWSIPGGVVEGNESPRSGCLREVKEEVGLDLQSLKLLCIDYISDIDINGENLQFVFFAGRISQNEINSIKLGEDEVLDWRFMTVEKAWPLLNKKYQLRFPKCLEALKNNTAIYLENGQEV